jgi:DNA invertase Pin-like site-specific DNA recombinase
MGTSSRRLIAYRRVSTQDQGDSGAGLQAQETSIKREVRAREWDVVGWYHDVASGGSMDKRPQLDLAIRRLQAGEADALVVAKLDRLSRSTSDFALLMDKARAEGWGLVVLDLGIDLATPAGEMVATIMASLAQWERRVISQRTRDALAERKSRGVVLGRPRGVSDEALVVIRSMRDRGSGWRAIAAELARLEIPTAQGGQWHPATVKKIAERI